MVCSAVALTPIQTDFMDKSKSYVKLRNEYFCINFPLYVSINRFLLKMTFLLEAVLTSELD